MEDGTARRTAPSPQLGPATRSGRAAGTLPVQSGSSFPACTLRRCRSRTGRRTPRGPVTRRGSGHDTGLHAAATPPGPSSFVHPRYRVHTHHASEVIAELLVHLLLVLPRRITRAVRQRAVERPFAHQTASFESAAWEPFGERPNGRDVSGRKAEQKKDENRYQYRSTDPPRLIPRARRFPRDHRELRRQRRPTRVRGRLVVATLGEASAVAADRAAIDPEAATTGEHLELHPPLRDPRVRSQPARHRPGSPRPATDPDSLYLPTGCGQGRRFSESAAASPGGAGWFNVVGRGGAPGRSRW